MNMLSGAIASGSASGSLVNYSNFTGTGVAAASATPPMQFVGGADRSASAQRAVFILIAGFIGLTVGL